MVQLPTGFSPLETTSILATTSRSWVLPVFDSHKGPTRKPFIGIVAGTRTSQNTFDLIRAYYFDLNIPSSRVINPYFDVNMLETFEIVLVKHCLCDGYCARYSALGDELPSKVLFLGHPSVL